VILSDPTRYRWVVISDVGQITPCAERATVSEVLRVMLTEGGYNSAHLDPRGFVAGFTPEGGRIECHVLQ
jgi:hypothetical protein